MNYSNKKIKNKYINLNHNFDFVLNHAFNKKDSFQKITNLLEINLSNKKIKIQKNKNDRTISIQFEKKQEKWLILKIISSGIKKCENNNLRIIIPSIHQKIKNNIDRLLFYHEKTKIFFITFSNIFVVINNSSSTFGIDLWWFLYFQKYGAFIKLKKRKGTKDKILITQSFEDILNWVWKNEENNWNYEDILKTKKIKEITQKKLKDLCLKQNLINEHIKNKTQLSPISDLKISENWFENIKKDISKFNKYPTLEKQSLTKIRIGQGWFREKLITKYKTKCPITLINNPKLLFASHIKPWKNSNKNEKLDSKNGILLSPLFDKLFDEGLISFQKNGQLIYSEKELSEKFISQIKEQIKNFKYFETIIKNVDKKYLKWHREKIFVQ